MTRLASLLEAVRDAVRVLRFMNPEQFAEHLRDVREVGQELQSRLDDFEESENEEND